MPALSEILSEVSLFILTEIFLSVINEDINLLISTRIWRSSNSRSVQNLYKKT